MINNKNNDIKNNEILFLFLFVYRLMRNIKLN